MLETAVLLPLLVLGIFFFIWLGTVMHAKSSLDAAVARAVRLACTRGVSEVAGMEVIQRVQDWQRSGDDSGIEPLLKNGDFSNWLEWYDDRSNQIFSGVSNLISMPSEYIYALVYVNEAMKQSVGAGVRYPCDPEDLVNGGGCLGCSFLNPDTLESGFPSEDPAQWAGPPPRRSIGLECRYQPDHTILKPLVKFIAMLTGDLAEPLLVLKKKAIVDVPGV